MRKRFVLSPMARGNGAYVLHKTLEGHIDGYRVCGYDPRWEFFPLALPFFFRNEKPSLIHTTPDYGLFFHRNDIPHVITVHHLVLDSFMRQYSLLFQRIHYKTDLSLFTRISLNKADAVTAVSNFSANMVRSELGFAGPIRVIYNGIDTDRFFPGTKSEKRQCVRVLFAGNLSLRKGANLLPEIARRLAPRIEILYTSGLRGGTTLPALPNLKKLGKLSVEEMPYLYQRCDILLFPSVREGFGLVAAEAMACGLPVVATDCSALPELIDHGKGGFLCPVGDIDTFAGKINLLAESPRLRREMGEHNRAKVEKMFKMDQMIRQYRDLFEEVLSSRR